MSHFEVTATDGAARAGILRTAHGEIETPAFMPVGTKATVKTLDPDELRTVGSQIILGNTYHLHLRPGEEIVRSMGGLHRFTTWVGPLLTDSGGPGEFARSPAWWLDATGTARRDWRSIPVRARAASCESR